MKTKNVILGLAATMLAVGGAWASSVFITYNHVTVVKNGKCRLIQPVDCTQAGNNPCQVTITGPGAGIYTVSPNSVPTCSAATAYHVEDRQSIFLD